MSAMRHVKLKCFMLILAILSFVIATFIYFYYDSIDGLIITGPRMLMMPQLQLSSYKTSEICVNVNANSYPKHILDPITDNRCPLSSIQGILLNSNINNNYNHILSCKKHSISFPLHTKNNTICHNDVNNEINTNNLLNKNHHDVQRYKSRADDTKCDEVDNKGEVHGMWHRAGLSQQKCYFLLGASYIKELKPNDIVLDWGAGCGHQIFWLYQYFGAFGVGLDLIDGNKHLAMKHFHKIDNNNGPLLDYCSGDATNLSYIDDNMFDHIMSIGAILHLEFQQQCDLILNHLIRIIKPAGTIWLGWNGWEYHSMTINDWDNCLNKYNANTYGDIKWEMFYDLQQFDFTIYYNAVTSKLIYSIYINKL